MRITMPNGTVFDRPFSPANCTGYVALDISLDGHDVSLMRRLLERDSATFYTALLQLEARFPENRPTPVPGQLVKTPEKSAYRCGPCGSTDPTKYMRCNHAGCPDGRDR